MADDEPHALMGRQFWLKVDDSDLWTIGTVSKVWQGQVHFARQHTPKGVASKVVLDESAVAALRAVKAEATSAAE